MDTIALDSYIRTLRVLTKDHYDYNKYKQSYSKLIESEKMLVKTKSDLTRTLSDNSISTERICFYHKQLLRISSFAIEAQKNIIQFIFQDLSEYLLTKFYSDVKDLDPDALKDVAITLKLLKNQIKRDSYRQKLNHVKENVRQILNFIRTYLN